MNSVGASSETVTYKISDMPSPQNILINSYTEDKSSTLDFENFHNPNLKITRIQIQDSLSPLTRLKDFSSEVLSSSTSLTPSRYGSYFLNTISPKTQNYSAAILFNFTSPQSVLPFTVALTQKILQMATNNNNLQYSMSGAGMTVMQHGKVSAMDVTKGTMLSVLVGFAFAFIPGVICMVLVEEKAKSLKHQQMVSGISLFGYWLSNFIIDIVFLYISIIVLICIMPAFGSSVRGGVFFSFFLD